MTKIIITDKKRAGRTRRIKRKSPGRSVNVPRGPWLHLVPGAAKYLHDTALAMYDGDRARLAAGHGLTSKKSEAILEDAMRKKFPELFDIYKEKFGRELTGHHLVRRVRFMYERYTRKEKISGVRSNEHRSEVP